MKWIADEHGSDRGSADDDQFGRLDEHLKISVLHQVSRDHRAEDNHNSDNGKHSGSAL